MRARGMAWLILVLTVTLAFAAGGCTEAATSSTPTSAVPSSANSQAAEPTAPAEGADAGSSGSAGPSASVDLDLVPATVTRVVDGDTAVMTLKGGKSERVRFIGVDTPESTTEHEPYGAEASAFTKKRLTGKQVWLQIGTEQRDRYDRLLAYVWLQPPLTITDAELRAKQFNAELLIQGYAQLLTIPPNTDYVEQYRVYQAEAREANRGLWGLESSTSGVTAPIPPPNAGTGSSETPSAAYIGNRSSKKFHYASCTYVGRMNTENKVPFASREAAVSAGYVPCKVCQP